MNLNDRYETIFQKEYSILAGLLRITEKKTEMLQKLCFNLIIILRQILKKFEAGA